MNGMVPWISTICTVTMVKTFVLPLYRAKLLSIQFFLTYSHLSVNISSRDTLRENQMKRVSVHWWGSNSPEVILDAGFNALTSSCSYCCWRCWCVKWFIDNISFRSKAKSQNLLHGKIQKRWITTVIINIM